MRFNPEWRASSPYPVGGRSAAPKRATRAGAPLPVLFASGYTDHTIGEEWAVGEQVPFLQKPYSRAAVARKVREALDATASVRAG